jgi:hypothetical protein
VATHTGKTKAQLLELGWHWRIACRVYDRIFDIRRAKIGWIERSTQELFRDKADIEKMWDSYEAPPVVGDNRSNLSSESGKAYLYVCWKPSEWKAAYKQKRTW